MPGTHMHPPSQEAEPPNYDQLNLVSTRGLGVSHVEPIAAMLNWIILLLLEHFKCKLSRIESI